MVGRIFGVFCVAELPDVSMFTFFGSSIGSAASAIAPFLIA